MPSQPTVRSYRDLKVWQRSIDLSAESLALAKRLPRSAPSALRNQIQRAALSIPANIAEGNGRRTRADYLRHLSIANGSLLELETHIAVTERMAYLAPDALTRVVALSSEVGRMLAGLVRALHRAERSSPASPGPDPDPGPGPRCVNARP
jgi:four helix bundle protein